MEITRDDYFDLPIEQRMKFAQEVLWNLKDLDIVKFTKEEYQNTIDILEFALNIAEQQEDYSKCETISNIITIYKKLMKDAERL